MKKLFSLLVLSVICSLGVKAEEVTPTLPALPSQTLNVMTTTEYTATNGYIVLNAYSDIFYSGSNNNTVVSWAKATSRRSASEKTGWTAPEGTPFTSQDATQDNYNFLVPNYNGTTWCTYAMLVTGTDEVQIMGKCGNHTDKVYLDVYEVNGSTVASEKTASSSFTETNVTSCKVSGLDIKKKYVVYVYGKEDTNNRFYQIAFKVGFIPYTSNSWDFSRMTIPYADNGTERGGLWYYGTNGKTDRVNNCVNFTAEELYYYADATAKESDDKTIFAPTAGLKFTTTNTSSYSLELRANLIYISRSGVVVTIPDCKKGQTVSVKIQAGAASRGFNTTNLSAATMFVSAQNTWETFTATVVADGDVTLTSNNGISLQAIETYYNVNVANIGWASLYFPFDATIPAGVKAYYAKSANASTIALSEIADGVIPANEGVVISAAKGSYKFTVSDTPGTAINGNLFDGVTEATSCEANANYVLSGESTAEIPVFGLYTGTTLGAYKAYLPATNVPSAGQARIRFVFDGSTTSIGSIENNISKKTAVKKIIRNGQIILETAKGTFNTFGARIK